MNIEKGKLEVFFNVLQGTEGQLSLSESRIRDSVAKPLKKLVKAFQEDKNKIYTTFCLKKEDGSLDLADGNRYQFPNSKLDEINKEIDVLTSEMVDIPIPEGFKDILEKSDYKPRIGEAEIIDSLIATLS